MTDDRLRDSQFIKVALRKVRPTFDTDDVECDLDGTDVSRNDAEGTSDGAYVKVWVWVHNSEAMEETP